MSGEGCISLNCLSVYHLPLATSIAVVAIQNVQIGWQLLGFNVRVDLEFTSIANSLLACMHQKTKLTGIEEHRCGQKRELNYAYQGPDLLPEANEC